MKKNRKKEMSEPITFRLPLEDYGVLEKRAGDMGLSDGHYVRTLVVPLLREPGK